MLLNGRNDRGFKQIDMDRLTPQQRHTNMAAIHGKDTKPEMVVGTWVSLSTESSKIAGEARHRNAEV